MKAANCLKEATPSSAFDDFATESTTDAKRSKLSKESWCKNRFGKLVFAKSPSNVAHMVRNAEIHGCRPQYLHQFPLQIVKSIEERKKQEIENLPSNILILIEFSRRESMDLSDEKFNGALDNILDLLLNDSKASEVSNFLLCSHGIEILADILVGAFYKGKDEIEKEVEVTTVAENDIPTLKMILHIMYHSTQVAPIGISHLSRRPHVVHLLFSLLAEQERKTFTDATQLLEEVIMSGPERIEIDLKSIACLPALLKSRTMSHQQEAHLFHILATAISASDSLPSVDISLQEHDRWLMSNLDNQINKNNQEYLINVPQFIEKLFNLTSWKVRYQMNLFRNIFGSFLSLPESIGMSEEERAEFYDRMLEDIPDNPLYQVHLYHEKSIRADAFLLLSLLLTGKYREEMQHHVLAHNLIQRLEKTVASVVWQVLEGGPFPDHVHGDYGVCGPETTVKIQYLRLIHSISDHHIHRYLMLNEAEIKEIEEISEKYGEPLCENFSNVDRSKCCVKRQGLLTEIIKRMKQESGSSYIRFWMTRALELFLRGSTCPVNQIFLINRNVVEELFSVLLSNEQVSSEVIQGHFDLLASVMKDNVHAFRRFSKVIDCSHAFQKLCRIIDGNLVDSNMFVRCVVLSMHHFTSVKPEHRELVEKCQILTHYSTLKKRVQAIVNLISVLTVDLLSQENVSCLNTSIIILLIAKANDQLRGYLEAIATYDEDGKCGRKVLENLRLLLEFWLEHYTLSFKENDIKSLEESTGYGFAFTKWMEMVSELISRDGTSPNSIMHHISPAPQYKLQPTTSLPSCIRTS